MYPIIACSLTVCRYTKRGQITGALTASDHIEIFEDILTGNTVMSGGGYIHMLGSEGNFLVRSSKSVVKKIWNLSLTALIFPEKAGRKPGRRLKSKKA